MKGWMWGLLGLGSGLVAVLGASGVLRAPRPAECAIAGLTCFAVAWLSRMESRRLAEMEHRLDPTSRLEALGTDLAQVRASMQELRIERVRLESALNALPRDLAQAQENATREAVFRLAASLDQLHAKLEARMDQLESRVHEAMTPPEPPVAAALPQVLMQPLAAQKESRSPAGLGLLDSFDDA